MTGRGLGLQSKPKDLFTCCCEGEQNLKSVDVYEKFESMTKFNEREEYDNIFHWLRDEREARCDEIALMLSEKPSELEPSTFFVYITRNNIEPLGMEILNSGGMCKVGDMKDDGLVARWGRNNPEEQILVGDWILSANGFKNYKDIRTVCRTVSVLRLQVSRRHKG